VTALSGDDNGPIATNQTGANMPAGHVAALAESPAGAAAVLEVDEGYLGRLIEEAAPRVVILLNLSRDQLDRISEVRMLADRWRTAVGALPGGAFNPSVGITRGDTGTVVVANADDPLVVWAASTAPTVLWVGVGQVWRNDSVGCPACGGTIEYGHGGRWGCDHCDFARPPLAAWLEGSELVTADGHRWSVDIKLPGQFNRANAAMVALAGPSMHRPDHGEGHDGIAPIAPLTTSLALTRLSMLEEVQGRFSRTTRRGYPVRLLLAKNPAGWSAIFDLMEETDQGGAPVVLSINARVADGFDPSWLWDVPFERLVGRQVIATGDRRLDLAVRLRYAEVDTVVVSDPLDGLDRAIEMHRTRAVSTPGVPPASEIAGEGSDDTIDFLGNYTAFAELRSRL
jgi:UDP-N-acetylmuramyl tripeptide synthase